MQRLLSRKHAIERIKREIIVLENIMERAQVDPAKKLPEKLRTKKRAMLSKRHEIFAKKARINGVYLFFKSQS